MKPINAVMFFIAAATLTLSCKKDPSYQITGKWQIIKDSSYVEPASAFNTVQGPGYTGTAGDYYDFKPGGSLYIKEGSYTDTLTYSTRAGGEVVFNYNTYNNVVDALGNIISRTHRTKSYSITALSATKLILTSKLTTGILTPVGYLANTILLEK